MKHLLAITELAGTQDWRELRDYQLRQRMDGELTDDFSLGEVKAIADAFAGTGGRSRANHLFLNKSIRSARAPMWDTLIRGRIDLDGWKWECELPNRSWDTLDNAPSPNFVMVSGKRDFMVRIVKSSDDYYFVRIAPGYSLIGYLAPIKLQDYKYYVCDGLRSLKALISAISK